MKLQKARKHKMKGFKVLMKHLRQKIKSYRKRGLNHRRIKILATGKR